MATNFPNGLSSRGVPVENAGSIPMGVNNVYWVDGTNGDDTKTGRTKARAWKTIPKFYANDAEFDVCLVMPGTYTVPSGSLPMTPLANTKLIAAVPSPRPNVVITDDRSREVLDKLREHRRAKVIEGRAQVIDDDGNQASVRA